MDLKIKRSDDRSRCTVCDAPVLPPSDTSHHLWVIRHVRIHHLAFLLRAPGSYERMQRWQMWRECVDRDKKKKKAEKECRKRRRGGEQKQKKPKKTGTEIRFTLVAGLRDDFPYQQARGSGQIWFSPPTRQQKTDRERSGREVTGKGTEWGGGKRGKRERIE